MALPLTPPAAAGRFLARHGWQDAALVPLAGDASFRRYFRATAPGRRAVLMDAPPDREDTRPFLTIAAHLDALGFSAPRALAVDLDEGLVLLEDFGDLRVNPLLAAEPGREEEVYARAVDLLVDLHRHAPPPELPPYDREAMTREAMLFVDWYLPAAGVEADRRAFLAAWEEVWGEVLDEVEASPVLVLRDYHADNLMLLPERDGTRRLGLLDFQDALAGHRAYDLASLLQDARRDVPTDIEALMLDRYVGAAGIADRHRFRSAYEVLAAQRNTKILGIFTRLWKRDEKPCYRALLPRVWSYLDRNLQHPALEPVRLWFEGSVPPAARAFAPLAPA